MDMTANGILLPSHSENSHGGNYSRLSTGHSFHSFVSVIININLLECNCVLSSIKDWWRWPSPFRLGLLNFWALVTKRGEFNSVKNRCLRRKREFTVK